MSPGKKVDLLGCLLPNLLAKVMPNSLRRGSAFPLIKSSWINQKIGHSLSVVTTWAYMAHLTSNFGISDRETGKCLC
jgi:hypothetical protein